MSVLEHIRQAMARTKFPKIKHQHAQGGLKWKCCNLPFRARTRKGSEQVWMSWCMWRKGKDTGGMNRVVGRATASDTGTGNKVLGPMPKLIKIKGKRMMPCK